MTTPHHVRPPHHELPRGHRLDGIGHDATHTPHPRLSTAPPGLFAPAPEVVAEKVVKPPKMRAKATVAAGRPSRAQSDRVRVAACGTPSGYDRHRRNGEEACSPCRTANTAAKREYAQRNKPAPKERPRPACGTWGGRKAHTWRGEEVCEPCVIAYREYSRDRWAARRAGQGAPIPKRQRRKDAA